jgi:nucleotide-binding universal stress UspA family protein
VIRSAACSCLVVREPLRLPLTRVVVPMDLSEPARGALEAALTWSGMLGGRAPDGAGAAELDVVHVIPRLLAAADRPVDQPDVGPRLHREVEAALAGREPRPLVREELVRGDDPAGEIVRHARDVGAELLVVATHGHGAVKRALIGSVASAVARRAATPVLLVPPSRWSGHPSAAVRERAHAGAR